MPCPSKAFTYNRTLCSCSPGSLVNITTNTCYLYVTSSETFGNDFSESTLRFPETIFSFDSIKKLTQSQALLLEVTLAVLLCWLVFCFSLRFASIADGRNIWFRIRWWISRLDVCFATRHWMDDQTVVMKRKTELGGTFSMASVILLVGLFAAFLCQIISKQNLEFHYVRASSALELSSFNNHMEFNITTVSSMSCSSLRGLRNLVTVDPGVGDKTVSPLKDFLSYRCQNSSLGPTISFMCNHCHFNKGSMYISWQYVDLPSVPATAVGFQFNFTVTSNTNMKYSSSVYGVLRNGSFFNDTPVTFRGSGVNMKFSLVPRVHDNLNDLKIMQPLFHDFIPGSVFYEERQLKDSLENWKDGLLNITLHLNILSSYIIEIHKESIFDPVRVLADLGGLYCISIAIFFYFLVQCEFRVKAFRNEDLLLQNIRKRLRAQKRWDKLRKYVKFTWGRSTTLDDVASTTKQEPCCDNFMFPPFPAHKGSPSHLTAPLRAKGPHKRKDTLSSNTECVCQQIPSSHVARSPSSSIELPQRKQSEIKCGAQEGRHWRK